MKRNFYSEKIATAKQNSLNDLKDKRSIEIGIYDMKLKFVENETVEKSI